jgi:secreted PhoX family phosphatase
MMELSRRKLFAGAAAASAATALTPLAGGSVQAAAPAAGKQNAGWYRYKVGSFEVTVVTDGSSTAPLTDLYVRNAPKADVSAALVALHAAADKVTNLYNPIVVNTGSKLVAIDTGAGPGAYQQSKG